MPLFTFKCLNCAKTKEKFIKDKEPQFECECGSIEFERQFGPAAKGSIWKGAQDHLENIIKPEINRIQENLSKGDDNTFLDIAGDK